MKSLDRSTALAGLASWSAVALLLGLALFGWPSRAALLGWLGVALGSGLAMFVWWSALGMMLARPGAWSTAGASRLAAWTFAPLAAGWVVALLALSSPEFHHNLIHSPTVQRRFIFLLAAPTLLAQGYVLLRAYSSGSPGPGDTRRWSWWPVVAVGLLGLGPVVPHLAPGYLWTPDAPFHLVNTLDLRDGWLAGDLLPWWSGKAFLGFGLPTLAYYPPLTYALAAATSFLPGVDAAAGLQLTLALAGIAAAIGTYGLVNTALRSSAAGVLAAIVYVYAPYRYITIYQRAALPEHVALAALPWLLWAVHGLVIRPSGGRLVASALASATILATHNISALFALPLAGVYGLGLILMTRRFRRLLPLAGGLALGLALGSAVWLPAMADRDAATTHVALAVDYRTQFVALRDALNGNFTYKFYLGYRPAAWQIILLAGALAWLVTGPRSRGTVALWVLLALVSFGLLLDVSAPLWPRIPLLPFVQLPWRLLGPFSLLVACAAGTWVARFRGPTAWPLVALLAAVTIGSTWELWRWGWGTQQDPAPWVEGRSEIPSFAEYNPISLGRWVPGFQPPPGHPYHEGLWDGLPLRVAHGEARLTVRSELPRDIRADVSAATDVVLWAHRLLYAGWRVTIDGHPAAVRALDEWGIIVFDLPAGTHEVRVFLEPTPARQLGRWLSVAALPTCAVVLAWPKRWSASRYRLPAVGA
ncbi:MAG: hypothetical protein CL878_03835 [Dehalococcoidia bacterium]|nr:hypothetical protein [Dehalococcoidia bacterium]